jgi:hypothetical protein
MPNQKIIMVADTETVGLGKKAFVFDFGYVIGTKKGVVLKERQFLIREVLTNPKIMLHALYNPDWRTMMGGKLFSIYMPALGNAEMKIFGWREVLEIMRDDINTYGVNVFSAYNLNFDLGALNKTHNMITEKSLDFSRLQLLCLWEFSCITVCRSRLFHDVAREQGQENGWITPAENVRTTAEKVYAFLTGDYNFIESHTALHDAQIEFEIMQRLMAKKTKIPYDVLDHMPWRKAQKRKDAQLVGM